MKILLNTFILLVSFVTLPKAQSTSSADLFLSLLGAGTEEAAKNTLAAIGKQWKDGFAVMAIETITLARDQYTTTELFRLLQKHTSIQQASDLNDLFSWLWKSEEVLIPDYDQFKARLYGLIDPKFPDYFNGHVDQRTIRLDEIRWGGVKQDGIPPLHNPNMLTTNEATYLDDDNVVFGIEVNGDARAYPKRILAWHEMFTDEVGGLQVAGVYCTLCGTVILFDTEHNGTRHELGTSGFLYRSNKLMFDKATQSLWNTMQGQPVVGPLVGKGIQLKHLSVVTTTWGEWKKRHPDTRVLSLDTGHRRDYSEGAAYRSYFATDQLMFNTPFNDRRLSNKAEVLALRFEDHPDQQLAIAAKFLEKNPVYEGQLGNTRFVVFTDKTGGNRVYKRGNLSFRSFDGNTTVTDRSGKIWSLSESALTSESGETLDRLPYHRAFWFGWVAAFPETGLVK